MSLRDLSIVSTYSSDDNSDLLNDFYNPVLSEAKSYDRITGFFSPKVFAIASRGFRECIKNNCKIRLITSIVVDNETYEAINETTRLSDITDSLKSFNPDSLQSDLDYDYIQLFMALYKSGLLELKVAATTQGNGILHEKIGIIVDEFGNAISFSGSNNETASGWINNVEEFKVFKNWESPQIEYYESDKTKFEKYWDNKSTSLKVITLDEAESEELIRKTNSSDLSIEEIAKKIKEREEAEQPGSDNPPTGSKPPRELREYQKEAIQHWKDSGYITVFEMATGTGKTFTTINALADFADNKGFIRCVIGVPLISLLSQWKDEIRAKFGDDIKLIVASSAVDPNWRDKIRDLKIRAKLGLKQDFIILSLYVTLANQSFIDELKQINLDGMLLLADEMHNLVTERCLNLLTSDIFEYRLGLSATPVRLWKPEESSVVMNYFGDDPYVFTLERAIREGFLVPYNYSIIPAYLTVDEFEEYLDLSHKIGRYYAMKDSKNPACVSLMLKRARIKKNAENKKFALANSIDELRAKGAFHHALIYVDNNSYISEVQNILDSKNIPTSKFTGEETLDMRQSIIKTLREQSIDSIVAIKCLDEGVDIPSARNAFFVSSNTDPREYIQRLGRVLRLDKESNKQFANIYDYIVLPPKDYIYEEESDRTTARNLIKNEMIRINFFCSLALNADVAMDEINRLIDELNMTFSDEELIIKQESEDF